MLGTTAVDEKTHDRYVHQINAAVHAVPASVSFCRKGKEGDVDKKGKDEKERLLPFVWPGVSKLHSTPGDFYGTFFTEPLKALDPVPRGKPPRVRELPNVRVNPAKKGGPGYVDITISKYPQYKVPGAARKGKGKKEKGKKDDARLPVLIPAIRAPRLFTENPYRSVKEPKVPVYVKPVKGKTKTQVIKRILEQREEGKGTTGEKAAVESAPKFLPAGPAKEGVFFTKLTYALPPPMVVDMKARLEKLKEAPSPPVFYPTRGTKPYPQSSVVSYNIDRSVNASNWLGFKPIVYP
ncbi:uncharacterized protein LOC134533430 [Bacillus rossius redtenbacheri]|uniref:uncharacterized protein LOC134533430 n=1 Tax=Bacillus rossius redtenbacheri TaxID=93214 RepID=UPI002FDDADB5